MFLNPVSHTLQKSIPEHSWQLYHPVYAQLTPVIRRLLSNFSIIYLFIREEKGGRKTGREISMCRYLSRAPYWGPGPQPRNRTNDPVVLRPALNPLSHTSQGRSLLTNSKLLPLRGKPNYLKFSYISLKVLPIFC